MSWNNGYETKKFEARQKKQAEEYRALGMTEEQIKAMYEFDLEQFKSERRYRMHTQPLQVEEFEENDADESDNTLLNEFFDELTCTIETSGDKSRYWWVEEIEDEALARRVKSMVSEEIEMITLLVFEGYKQIEASQKMGMPYRTFKFKFRNIKEFLKNF
jgi:DNA-directed RNA polymerase specialized sigma24 family protein